MKHLLRIWLASAGVMALTLPVSSADDVELIEIVIQTNANVLTLDVPTGTSNQIWEVYSTTQSTVLPAGGSWQDLSWVIAETNLQSTNALTSWSDLPQAGIPEPSEVTFRYYAFGNAQIDDDQDDLCNAREYLVTYTDAQDPDTDDDGLTDGEELLLHGTDPLVADTDHDGMPDGWEVDYGLNPLSGFHDSLVGWWPFDDGTGTSAVNSAMSGYDGELMNMSTSAWGQGVLGGALSFDGSDDYVRVLQSPAMLTGSEFTACGWVYLDPSYSADYPTLIADMGSCGSYYDGFWLGHDDDYVPAVAALLDDCTSPLTYPYATASITGAWVHLAVTVSGTSSILYLNGVEVASATGGFSPSEQSEVRIGWGNDPSYTYHWKG
ncbi:MAG: LamG domain-containing protein, partial [Saprospiraceae bacterium]|nr:LamG domain-containing protein [Saprospiraceae bacterium]